MLYPLSYPGNPFIVHAPGWEHTVAAEYAPDESAQDNRPGLCAGELRQIVVNDFGTQKSRRESS